MKFYYVYIFKCNDESFYTGVTNNLEKRISQYELGYVMNCYTYKRRPLELVYSVQLDDIKQAIALEKQIKGWGKKKKEAFIREDWDKLKLLSKNYTDFGKVKE